MLYTSNTKCRLPHWVEPPLAETDHLWHEHFTHKPPPGLQDLVTLVVTFTPSDAGEIQDGVCKSNMGERCKNCEQGVGGGGGGREGFL